MTKLALAPIAAEELPQVATFFHGWKEEDDDVSATGGRSGRTAQQLLEGLRWRFADTPAACERIGVGQSVRKDDGSLVGALLYFPARFVLGDRRLIGLCASGYYVDPVARMHAGLLFRRFMTVAGIDFWFATTCNRRSGAVWQKFGARDIDYSRFEYLIPTRPGPLVEELVLRRFHNPGLARIAGFVGRLASPAFPRTRPKKSLKLQRCSDWERLADLAGRYRDSQCLTSERSAEYLRWRYEASPARAAIEVLLAEDDAGRQAWVSLESSTRGRRAQIRAWTVLDLVYPRSDFDLDSLLADLVQSFSTKGDVIALRGPDHLTRAALRIGASQRTLPSTPIFLRAGGSAAGELSHLAELFPADGDTAD